jgi:hypothetical protein
VLDNDFHTFGSPPAALPKATAELSSSSRALNSSKPGARSGSKTAKILDMLRRPGGASARELLKATGWQSHSLRGFLSGTVGKKMGLSLTSTKREDSERVYALKA